MFLLKKIVFFPSTWKFREFMSEGQNIFFSILQGVHKGNCAFVISRSGNIFSNNLTQNKLTFEMSDLKYISIVHISGKKGIVLFKFAFSILSFRHTNSIQNNLKVILGLHKTLIPFSIMRSIKAILPNNYTFITFIKTFFAAIQSIKCPSNIFFNFVIDPCDRSIIT